MSAYYDSIAGDDDINAPYDPDDYLPGDDDDAEGGAACRDCGGRGTVPIGGDRSAPAMTRGAYAPCPSCAGDDDAEGGAA